MAPDPAPTRPLRVLHLAGSAVSDFYADVSRLYAADCLTATADPERYDSHVAYVTPDRRWRFPADLRPASIEAAPAMELPEAIAHLVGLGLDLMVPQMFCRPGMTRYRALFELLGVPYLGNRPGTMSLGADKAQASAVVARHGVRVPAARVVRPGDRLELDLPVVVKPVDADNSLGLSLVREAPQWDGALRAAAAHDGGRRALAETYVELGREVRCGVVDVAGELVCLPLEEYAVDAATKPVRDAADKLHRDGDGHLALVAKDTEHAWLLDLDDPITAAVHAAARASYEALGCRHYGLFDFRVDPDGVPFFLEAGLYCSYARTSVIAVMAQAAGIGLDRLFALAADDALRTDPDDPDPLPAPLQEEP